MEVQSTQLPSAETATTTASTSDSLAPVVVTPTKDTTHEHHGTDDSSICIKLDEELLMPNSIVAEAATGSIVKCDDDDEDEQRELDPTILRVTSTSSSPLITTATTTGSAKKRPATVSSTGTDNKSSHNVTPVSSTAKRNHVSTATKSPSAVARNWKQASMVHAELAALKQRGLAKLLNQHFTSTAQQLAVEKAAADAAILDLQERKARTKEFTPTNSSEISPLDQACIQANKWRAECRRKERETLLLYQQYVHKFGPTTILPVPTVPTTTHDTTKALDGTTTKTSKLVVIPTAPMGQPPQPSRPVPTLVPNMTAQIEQTLEEYCARGAVAHPSIMTHGAEQTYSSIAVKEEFVFREYYRKQLEAKGVDAVCSPGYFKGNGCAIDVFTRNTIDNQNVASDNDNGKRQDEWNKDDVCSIVSGLTTLHSAMTREFIYDCENSVQTFLRDEQATVRKLMEEEEQDYDASSSGDTHVSNVMIVQDSDATAKAAENMVQQMQDILQEYQKKHVGTANDTVHADVAIVEKEYPIVHPTSNTNEKWMIYYDEFYRQEYYHEIHTNRTQWDPPGKKSNDVNNDPPESSYSNSNSTDVYSVMNGGASVSAGGGSLYDDLGLYDDDDRMDRIIESSNHRVAAYRKRQRRKRRRRRIIATIIVIATMILICRGTYYHTCTSGTVDTKPSVCSMVDNSVMTHWKRLTTLVLDNSERSVLEIPRNPEQCMLQLEDEIAFLYRIQQMSLQEKSEVVEVIRRPWGCNIPLAYIFHSKCRRMASMQPIFDLQALINSMLQ